MCGVSNWLDVKQKTLLLRVLIEVKAEISWGGLALGENLREWKIIIPELIATDSNFRGPPGSLVLCHFLSCFIFSSSRSSVMRTSLNM